MLSCVDETVRYTYRLRPGATATAALLAEWGAAGGCGTKPSTSRSPATSPRSANCRSSSPRRAARNAWLRDGSQVAQQQMLRTYAQALQHSFTVGGRGRPVFKRRKDDPPVAGVHHPRVRGQPRSAAAGRRCHGPGRLVA